MRVLWISDSPDTPSGFGNVTRFVCQGLASRGHDVSIIGWQTKQSYEWNGCKVYPSMGRLASESVFPFLVRHRPEVVIALADIWWLPYFCSPHVRRQMELTDTPWALYFPVDGDMHGEHLPSSWIEMLRQVDVPIAMSRYGQRIAQQHGISCDYIPHGVDLSVFCPPADREESKKRIGAAGKFLVLSDSRNQPRKMLPRLLDIFAKFARDCPDSLLHLHTDPDDEFTQSPIYSYNVCADIHHLGIESKVQLSPGMKLAVGRGLPQSELAAYYQAADVHLLASSGEGFGLPTIQAAAAGCIPMAVAYTASLELVQDHGEAIRISEWTENEFGIRRGLIDIDDAVARLKGLYCNRRTLPDRSARCREFAMAYAWDSAIDQWDRLLSSLGRSKKRIARSPATRTEPFQKLMPGFAPNIPGVSVSLKVVERQLGRTEAAILADSRKLSEVRIPVLSKSCEVGGVKVPRTVGYLGMGKGDIPVFEELKRIFPVLSGWVFGTSSGSAGKPEEMRVSGLEWRDFSIAEEARFDLAQSVLLINVNGDLPRELLIDAALYGVPCIGTGKNPEQKNLWPELETENRAEAVKIARGLLTNAAWMQRASVFAQSVCEKRYAPDEEDSAYWLRQLHAQHVTTAAIGIAR